jgi:hypothetical protein
MPRIHIAASPETNLDAASFAAAWNRSDFGSGIGIAVTPPRDADRTYDVQVLVEVVVPIALNIASNVLYDGVVKLLKELRARRQAAPEPRVEITIGPDDDYTITIRD